jgi:uncharacterized membrane protein
MTGTVISSGIDYTKLWFPKEPEEVATIPLLRVKVSGLLGRVVREVSTKKEILAFDAILDFGVYPILLAIETTFSLNVALSMNTSLLTMLALYEEIYVLYARTSMIVERFDPSKS